MRIRPLLTALALVCSIASARAEDAFYHVPLKTLKLLEGKLPEPVKEGVPDQVGELLEPHVKLDALEPANDAEAYSAGTWTYWAWANGGINDAALDLRAIAGRDVTGTLYVPSADWKSMTGVRFVIPAASADPASRKGFYRSKIQHYESLLARGVPGAAWFRHQAREARLAIGEEANDPRQNPTARASEMEETYALFSGGRAVSENLQLDRALLPRPGAQEATVAIDSLKGIDVKAFDWKPLIAGKTPALDPLAALVPADQHAVYFPSFDAATALMEEIDRQGAPILQYAEPRSEDAGVKARYQRQLCLPLTRLGRILGPRLIGGMAFTGSDPYLRVGSDVAVLFEPKDLGALREGLTTQMGLNAGDAKPVSGEVGGISYKGYASPDRRVSAYLATVGQTIVVTNSLAQLGRVIEVHAGKRPAMATLPEYAFFRDRYPRGEAGEAGLIVMTDAAIRRWCSARWRIGDSRRTRAGALMAEVQARHIDPLARRKPSPAPLPDDDAFAGAGSLSLTASGIESVPYGSLEFMTPIAELELPKVTQAEADNYNRWRDTYQQNWKNYFDPIAIRVSRAEHSLAADMTVMPLIAASEYQQVVEVSQGAAIKPDSADPHGALVHGVMAINGKSERMKSYGSMAAPFVPQLKTEPFSWIGPTASFYVDDDPSLDIAAKSDKPEAYFENHSSQIPIGIRIESTDGLKMALFLTALHGFIDQSAPGAAAWETLAYREIPYVKITESRRNAPPGAREAFSLFYTTAHGALLLTPSEALLKRSLDRQLPATQPAAAAAPSTRPAPWLGQSIAARIDGAGLRKLMSLGVTGPSSRTELQRQSWDNLPILNEWKRRFPELDPLELHERLWQARLVDPAGGTYTWNPAVQSMESSLYGCPSAPKPGPAFPPALANLLGADLGITFENQGLRARVELRWP